MIVKLLGILPMVTQTVYDDDSTSTIHGHVDIILSAMQAWN
jgi:hypothetical protein